MPHSDPQQSRQFAVDVVRRLREQGHIAYWAGGCVRDQLIGAQPKDYDVATDATPQRVQEIFGRRTLAVGAAFGVITVLGPKNAEQIEVATFREDAPYTDGRHPDAVTFSTPEFDASRRDFTINGMFYDPLSDEVIDFVGGRDDLQAQVVRAIGDPRQRISEDKLRMLRAVRFAATFDFALEPETLAAVQAMASEIRVVSQERIGMEIRRMLTHSSRRRAVELLRESGLLQILLPEVAAIAACTDDWSGLLATLESLVDPSIALALATLLTPAGDAALAVRVAREFRFTNKESDRAKWLREALPQIATADKMSWPKLQRLLVSEGIDELLALHEAIAGPSDAALTRCRECLQFPPDQLDPLPLLSGDDLIAHGVTPGRHFRDLLDRLRDAQLEGEIQTREEALALADTILSAD